MGAPTRRRVLATTGGLVALAGCLLGSNSAVDELTVPETTPDDDWADPEWRPAAGVPSEDDVTTTTAVTGLEIPWDLVFAADDAFLTERDGGVRRFDAATLATDAELSPDDGELLLEAADLPDRSAPGEGGTLGITAHPEYPDRAELFIYYTVADGAVGNRVVSYDLESETLEAVLDGIPGATTHNGGRITFGPDGYLWVVTGDAENPALTQDPGARAGAVFRLTPDGEPASGNPDWGTDGDRRIYTLGHRNPQGIAFTPQGTPIVAEHGPSARDEVSILRPGGNYGWDLVRGGPDDPEYGSYAEYDDAMPPVVNTGPETTWAPSGIAFYDGDAIVPWENHVLVCGLGSNALYALKLVPDGATLEDGDGVRYDAPWLDDRLTATAYTLFEGEFGRLRHVEPGPDGSLYLLTSNRDGRASAGFPTDEDDRLIRLEPASSSAA
ncbi:PQQ-dependent sugar dehydrogenase [Natronorubrum sulfidifaciens]|uniref:Glucose sorbosone dehydrogenase n=1 Tax=Natronorubrum sulfidifaciens JCM 14089 TaxID=1230460 RepID=L9WF79_9EURY|nr:PQQ-dependent sugar dehydrogenase [Natronorubrum sulfidifaciens]ELY48114.1 glucose sorbosone dehydrogenase [Natronorubrum sulfidifaciens JCM 14089]